MKLILMLPFVCCILFSFSGEKAFAERVGNGGKADGFSSDTGSKYLNYQGQRKSLLEWDKIDPYEWLSIHRWIEQREQRDIEVDWKILLRDTRHKEIIGRVIQCIGVCQNFRGVKPISVGYLSDIVEGDEIETSKNSYSWIFLVDGTLIRLSPNTSISLNEINLSNKKTSFIMRLNHGHVHVESRLQGKFKAMNRAESDLAFYPLLLKEANRESFAIDEFNLLTTDAERRIYTLAKNKGHITQYLKLNQLLQKDLGFSKRDHEFLVYTPNLSLVGTNISLDLFYGANRKSQFRFSKSLDHFELDEDQQEKGRLIAFGRGYNNKDINEIEEKQWYYSSPLGDEIALEENPENYRQLALAREFIQRIPTIYMARELMIRKYSRVLFEDSKNGMFLSKREFILNHGYRLWNSNLKDELDLRKSFALEYVRRLETTNLRVMAKLIKKADKFNKSYYSYSMKLYYDSLKRVYSDSYNKMLYYNRGQYHMWVLRNGRK